MPVFTINSNTIEVPEDYGIEVHSNVVFIVPRAPLAGARPAEPVRLLSAPLPGKPPRGRPSSAAEMDARILDFMKHHDGMASSLRISLNVLGRGAPYKQRQFLLHRLIELVEQGALHSPKPPRRPTRGYKSQYELAPPA